MNKVHLVSAVIFTMVSIAHLVRLLTGAELIIEGWVVPMWISAFGMLIPGLLAFLLWRSFNQ